MTTAPTRPTIPITPVNRHGSRSRMTCLFRCGNACDHPEPNLTENGHIQQEITRALARRSVLKGAAVGSGALVIGGAVTTASTGLAAAAVEPARRVGADLATTGFAPVRPNKRDNVTVAEGFTHSVVMRWGDRVLPGAPVFDAYKQTAAAASMQFGYNCDYVGIFALGRDKALLVVNHEYTDENLMFPADTYTPAEIKAIAMVNHGMSVVTLKRGLVPGDWQQVTNLRNAPHNRRIHIGTPFAIVGPAAGDDRLKTVADPTGRVAKGTLNNCAGGATPWGTVLSGEENFNQYFDKSGDLDARYTAQYARYGITGAGRGWSEVDPRFDLTTDPHEPNRFGWIVEVDPTDPKSTPRKQTMLGRFKHEGANIVIARSGHAVAYMGDDERGDYIYRFVSADKFDPAKTAKARRHNLTLLTKGTLSVAKFVGDGAEDGSYDGFGSWIPLCTDTTSFVPGMSVADVLIFTRLAADKMGPTKMDRPEDVEPNPVNGKVYAALTNNSNRGKPELPVDEANPLASSMVRASLGAPLTAASGNRNGYVLEWTPAGGEHTAATFTWNLLLVCGDPAAAETYFGGVDKSTVSPISCPDNVSFDSDGNLWISTDGNVLGSNDGIFRVPVSGPLRGQVRQFVTMPRGAEACGPLITDRNRSLFFAVQHPGEIDGATFEKQASTWPHTDDFPRPSVCVAYKRR